MLPVLNGDPRGAGGRGLVLKGGIGGQGDVVYYPKWMIHQITPPPKSRFPPK